MRHISDFGLYVFLVRYVFSRFFFSRTYEKSSTYYVSNADVTLILECVDLLQGTCSSFIPFPSLYHLLCLQDY